MKRRWLGLSTVALLAFGIPAAHAVDPPLPDPNFAKTLTASPCTAEANDVYEQDQFAQEGWEQVADDALEWAKEHAVTAVAAG